MSDHIYTDIKDTKQIFIREFIKSYIGTQDEALIDKIVSGEPSGGVLASRIVAWRNNIKDVDNLRKQMQAYFPRDKIDTLPKFYFQDFLLDKFGDLGKRETSLFDYLHTPEGLEFLNRVTREYLANLLSLNMSP